MPFPCSSTSGPPPPLPGLAPPPVLPLLEPPLLVEPPPAPFPVDPVPTLPLPPEPGPLTWPPEPESVLPVLPVFCPVLVSSTLPTSPPVQLMSKEMDERQRLKRRNWADGIMFSRSGGSEG